MDRACLAENLIGGPPSPLRGYGETAFACREFACARQMDRACLAEARAKRERRLAGRQGFELGASLFSKVVMARDFWF
jgi:hypothetical protein